MNLLLITYDCRSLSITWGPAFLPGTTLGCSMTFSSIDLQRPCEKSCDPLMQAQADSPQVPVPYRYLAVCSLFCLSLLWPAQTTHLASPIPALHFCSVPHSPTWVRKTLLLLRELFCISLGLTASPGSFSFSTFSFSPKEKIRHSNLFHIDLKGTKQRSQS